MTNSKKRVVVLCGAGAIKAWGGIQTSELTQKILESSSRFLCKDNTTPILQHLYNKLKDSLDENEINFETLINCVDELIVHYSYSNNKEKKQSIHKSIFQVIKEDFINNFDIESSNGHTYKLIFPKGKKTDYEKPSYNNESPEQFYYIQLLNNILTSINSAVSKYSYHSPNNSKIKVGNKTVNENFQKWVKHICDCNILRLYTLNYDRVFKILANEIDIDLFEGFTYEDEIPVSGILPDIKKIITDFESNVHYNLHGSIFWNVNNPELPYRNFSPFIRLHPYPKFNVNNPISACIQSEKGNSMVISNIVTGFQKLQKTAVAPFKQMQYSFDKDCFITDEIVIVGYSFGDNHINSSLKLALQYNQNIRITLIDPCYSSKDGYDKLIKNIINIIPEIAINKELSLKYSNNNKTCECFDSKLIVHSMGFGEYLEIYSNL